MGGLHEPREHHRDLRDINGQPTCSRALAYCSFARTNPCMQQGEAGETVSLLSNTDVSHIFRPDPITIFRPQTCQNPISLLSPALHVA